MMTDKIIDTKISTQKNVDYSKYAFVKQWVMHYCGILDTVFPQVKKKDIKNFLYDLVDENISVPTAKLDNNYVHESMKFDLLGVQDWIEKTKPIVAGHGVFYRNQNEVINPPAQMLIHSMEKRAQYKSKLKIYKEGSYEYDMYDRYQGAEKVVANSYYGASGAPTSDYFNLYTATSVTSTAQSLISTAELAFEAFMCNNIQFFDIDDCLNYLMYIKNEKYEYEEEFLPPVFPEMVYERLVSMFHEWDIEDSPLLEEFVYSCSDRVLRRIYYKNNLYQFSSIPHVQTLLHTILRNVEEFKDPNKIPECIKTDLDELWALYKEFVFTNQFYFGRIKRLKAFKRKCVVAIDTDSNMIVLDPWIKYLYKTIIENDNTLSSREFNGVKFICINVMCFVLTKMVTEVLNKYTKVSNVPKEHRHRINMKNEFLFSRLILTPKKKRYGSSVRLREGREIFPEKVEVKGADFMKSSARVETKDYFMKLLKEEMLLSQNINIGTVLRKVADFEKIVRESLNKGEKNFLIPKNVKEVEAYANAYGQQGIRAVLLWNAIYPDDEIQLPEKIDMVKLALTDDDQLAVLKEKYPEIYMIIEKNILLHPDKKYAEKKAGVIALPSAVKNIPQWILEFTDYETIINDNTTKFNSFIDSLGVTILKSSKSEHFSNIIKI